MTVTITYGCDRCGTTATTSAVHKSPEGWTKVGPKDYCSKCMDEIAQEIVEISG